MLALVGVLVLALAGAVLWVADDDVAWDRVAPEFWAAVTELHTVRDLAGDGLVEGRDYAFMRTDEGRLLHWRCGRPIPVILIGQAPQGVEDLLSEATALLSETSGLRLVPKHQPEGSRDVEGAITVLYGALGGDAAETFTEELGQGGPASGYNGLINFGEVTILTGPSQAPHTLPAENMEEARAVLMHELAHTLGLDHSATGAPGVMNPGLNPHDLALSPGDEFALRAVGCPR
ncbi:MAG: hypothetical protein JHC98_03810 [Thermoleophilaceae bacterium]|nr:hypothetical protein [Thermoleophilaceae bacterium]